jgi:hypothetical protein
MVFATTEGSEEQWCFSNRKNGAKQLLDGVVSSLKEVKNCRTVVMGK